MHANSNSFLIQINRSQYPCESDWDTIYRSLSVKTLHCDTDHLHGNYQAYLWPGISELGFWLDSNYHWSSTSPFSRRQFRHVDIAATCVLKMPLNPNHDPSILLSPCGCFYQLWRLRYTSGDALHPWSYNMLQHHHHHHQFIYSTTKQYKYSDKR